MAHDGYGGCNGGGWKLMLSRMKGVFRRIEGEVGGVFDVGEGEEGGGAEI